MIKNGKSSGIDDIVNEQIKASKHIMMPIYIKLFNIIFDSGIFPTAWSTGIIRPIHKKKGSFEKPENYRPISLLSCLGKLFTLVINNRLNEYADSCDLISDCQAGFRKGFSTSDNIFTIYCLINNLLKTKRKLFCAFIDLKAAFDTVWRAGLWRKLIESNINGKCFNLIKNMYNNIKSCVCVNGCFSDYFMPTLGVRQGENLSPFLFAIYLNDLDSFLRQNNVTGVTYSSSEFDDNILIFVKLLMLLYADDTVLICESEADLHCALEAFDMYCKTWKLTVNTSKSKVVIFSKGRPKTNYCFYLNNVQLEIVNQYKYLGIFVSRSGSFFATKKHVAEQAKRASYSLLNKIKTISLPVDIQIDLFEKMVKPILLYGSEIWGIGNLDIIEQVQLKFYKQIFGLKLSTPNYMVYGELGIYPIKIDIYTRMINFWSKLLINNNQKLSSRMYSILYSLHEHNDCKSEWIQCIRNILISCGVPQIWTSQNVENPKWLTCYVKQKLKDLFINDWFLQCEKSSNYRIYKHLFTSESYLSKLSFNEVKIMLSFRTRNHKLPVEIGRWKKIDFDRRLCTLCKTDVGDEFHYILNCKYFRSFRKLYIKPYYHKHPNTLKFSQLMNSKNKVELKKLTKFIKIITQMFVS